MKSIYVSITVAFVLFLACGNPPNNPKTTNFGGGDAKTSPAPTSGNTSGGGTTTGTTTGSTTGGTTGTTTGGTTGGITGTTGLTYTKDIKPILSDYRCEGCHTSYANYAGVKAGISSIISRVATDNMPQGSPKVPADKKKTLADWAATPGMPQ